LGSIYAIKQKKTEKIHSLPCAKTKPHGKEGTPGLPGKGLCRVLWPMAHGNKGSVTVSRRHLPFFFAESRV